MNNYEVTVGGSTLATDVSFEEAKNLAVGAIKSGRRASILQEGRVCRMWNHEKAVFVERDDKEDKPVKRKIDYWWVVRDLGIEVNYASEVRYY